MREKVLLRVVFSTLFFASVCPDEQYKPKIAIIYDELFDDSIHNIRAFVDDMLLRMPASLTAFDKGYPVLKNATILIVEFDLSQDIPKRLLQKTTESVLMGEKDVPALSLHTYKIENAQRTQKRVYQSKCHGRTINDILRNLWPPVNYRMSPPDRHIVLATMEPQTELEMSQITKDPRILKQYSWILAERPEMSLDQLVHLVTLQKAENMNLGFIRYSPVDCTPRRPYSVFEAAYAGLFNCSPNHLSDRLTAVVHGLVALTVTYNRSTNPKDLLDKRRFDCYSKGEAPKYVHGIEWTRHTAHLMELRLWNNMSFLSLEKTSKGKARFRETARFDGKSPGYLTMAGRRIQKETLSSGLFANSRAPFRGPTFRLGTVLDEPLMMSAAVDSDGRLINATGLIVDLLEVIADIFKFKYQLYTTKDGLYGSKINETHWDGALGELSNDNVEFVATAMTVTKERSQAFYFLGPIMHDSVAILLRRPALTSGFFQMLHPFKPYVWLAILLSPIIASLLIYTFNRFSPYSYPNPDRHTRTRSQRLTLSEVVWSTMKSLLFRNVDVYPSAPSARAILIIFWLLVLLLHALWQADMTAFLTRSEVPLPFKSSEGFANQDTIKPLLVPGTSAYNIFSKASSNDCRSKIYQNFLKLRTSIGNTSEGVRFVLTYDNYALINDKKILQYAMNKNPDKLTLMDFSSAENDMAFATLPHRTFIEPMSKILTILHENGAMAKLRSKWWPYTQKLVPSYDAEYNPIGMHIALGALIIVQVFLGMGVVTLLFEIGINTVHRRCQVGPSPMADLDEIQETEDEETTLDGDSFAEEVEFVVDD